MSDQGKHQYKILQTCQYLTGDHDLEDNSETVTIQTKAVVTELEAHPRFFLRRSTGVIKYDVGLLTLETPIDFKDKTLSHIR